MTLSIIVPVYQVEKYIHKCLDSILSQYFNPNEVEVIVVNDGTPDKSMQVVQEFANHPSLKIVNQENQGLSGARNTGMNEARGEWVWFVDSDDWITPNSIQTILDTTKNRSEDVFQFKIEEFDEATGESLLIRTSPDENNIYSCTGSDMIINMFDKNIDITPMQQFVIRRSFLLENNLYFMRGIYHEDKEFAPKMLVHTKKVAYIPVVTYCYLRRSTGSITTNNELMAKRAISSLKIFQVHHELMNTIKDDEQKALKKLNYQTIRFFWSIAERSDLIYDAPELKLKQNECIFRKYIAENLFYDRDLKHFFCQIMYFIAPRWLYKHKKRI